MDPERVLEAAQIVAKRIFIGRLGRWQMLACLPLVVFAIGVLFGSLELLLVSAPLVSFVVLYYTMRLILLNGGEVYWAAFAGFGAFVVVGVLSLVWIFDGSRPWMIADADRIALQDELIQICIDQRLDESCASPQCRASSYEDADRACVNDWLAGCHTLGEPGLELDTLPYATKQHLDTLCAHYRIR